jgi:PEP-CTERM motif
MKRSIVAGLGAAVIATFFASSAAEAASIDFFFSALDGSITHDGSSLDKSSQLDFDDAIMLVLDVGPGDASGLIPNSVISLSADTSPPSADIIYGFWPGLAVDKPLGADVVLSWPITPTPGADVFTETLTTVTSINRSTPNAITVTMSGTVSDSKDLFKAGTPVQLIMSASQAGGSGTVGVEFTNTSSLGPSIPEPSTWVMMALGFGALGYAASRQPKANGTVLAI